MPVCVSRRGSAASEPRRLRAGDRTRKGNSIKVFLAHIPFLAVGGSADNKTCGQSQIRQKLRITYVIRNFCFFDMSIPQSEPANCAEQTWKIFYIPMFYLLNEMVTWEFLFLGGIKHENSLWFYFGQRRGTQY